MTDMNRHSLVWRMLVLLCVPLLLFLAYRLLDLSPPPPPEAPPEPPADLVIAGVHPAIRVKGYLRPNGEPVCNKVVHCRSLVAVSCQPETDGSLNYYDNTDGSLVMHCGGACMGGRGSVGSKVCEACPPPEWICERSTVN